MSLDPWLGLNQKASENGLDPEPQAPLTPPLSSEQDYDFWQCENKRRKISKRKRAKPNPQLPAIIEPRKVTFRDLIQTPRSYYTQPFVKLKAENLEGFVPHLPLSKSRVVAHPRIGYTLFGLYDGHVYIKSESQAESFYTPLPGETTPVASLDVGIETSCYVATSNRIRRFDVNSCQSSLVFPFMGEDAILNIRANPTNPNLLSVSSRERIAFLDTRDARNSSPLGFIHYNNPLKNSGRGLNAIEWFGTESVASASLKNQIVEFWDLRWTSRPSRQVNLTPQQPTCSMQRGVASLKMDAQSRCIWALSKHNFAAAVSPEHSVPLTVLRSPDLEVHSYNCDMTICTPRLQDRRSRYLLCGSNQGVQAFQLPPNVRDAIDLGSSSLTSTCRAPVTGVAYSKWAGSIYALGEDSVEEWGVIGADFAT